MGTKAMRQSHVKAAILLVAFIALAIFSASCGGGSTVAVPNAADSPAVNLSPANLSFTSQSLGTTSATQTITLTNSGNAALSITSIALTGTNASDFSQTNTCGSSVTAGANCTINVTFTPSASGSRTASVSITDNASGSPQLVSLMGTGTSTSLTVSISPNTASVSLSTTSQFTATVLNATNTAVTWSISPNSGAGTIDQTGKYTAPADLPSNTQVTITATSQQDTTKSASATVTITSNESVSVSPQNPTVDTGSQQAFTATVSGTSTDTTVTWSAASGSINPSSGLYTAPATVPSGGTDTVTATSQADPTKKGTSMVLVRVTPALLTVTTSSLPNGTVGVAYNATLAASGGTPPYTWSLASGQLPTGLSLSASGVTSGMPTAAGTYSFTIQVNDSGGHTASRSYSVSVASPISITTTGLPDGTVNVAYSATLSASGGTSPYTWGVSAGSLPTGLTLSGSGTISGTPNAASSYSFTIQVSDSGGLNSSKAFAMTIYAGAAFDQYGGVIQTRCPNGATGDWYTQQVGERWVLCDPLGNAFILRSVAEVAVGDTDTDATYVPQSYNTTASAKYASGPEYARYNAQWARLKAWDFNASGLGSYYNATTSWVTTKVPFFEWVSIRDEYQKCEQNAQCKNIWNLQWPPLVAYDSSTAHNITDAYEPAWQTTANADFVGDYNIGQWAASSWNIGFAVADSDNCSFCSAGSNFPNPGPWPHAGWIILGSAPHAWLKSYGAKGTGLFTSATNNSKAQLATNLQSEYSTISALNSAWGSSYDGFGTDGTQVTGAACATGSGGSSYSCTLNSNVDRFSLLVLVGGRATCADDGFGNLYEPITTSCGSVNYSTGAVTLSITVASGTAITASYWYGGYGVGNGLLDESNSGHAWIGDAYCLNNGESSSGGNEACNSGDVTTANYRADLDTFLQAYVTQWLTVLKNAYKSALPSGYTNKLFFGVACIGQIPNRAPARAPVIAAAGAVDDVTLLDFDPGTSGELGFVTSALGNHPYVYEETYMADTDSDWYGYAGNDCPAGTGCVCTTSSPCLSNNASQSARATRYNSDIQALWNYQGAAGTYQWVGGHWWAWLSLNFWEHQNYGLVSWRDNAYDGNEDTTSSISCSAPLQAYSCGGEQNSYGNFTGPATLTNNWVDAQILLVK